MAGPPAGWDPADQDEVLAVSGDAAAVLRDGQIVKMVCGRLLVDHPDDGAPALRIPEHPTRHLTDLESNDLDQLEDLLRNNRFITEEQVHGSRLTHRPATTIKVVPPVWLWTCWMVAGAVQLLVGRQGSGKSTFAAWVVAQITSGRPWPEETEHRTPQRCGMLSLEEPADRLVARLVAAGAQLAHVSILGDMEDHDDDGSPYRRPWRLPGDCAALETAIRQLGLTVVTIDGLGYSVGGDSHNYANVGAALSALAGVAERTGCCILGLTHPPKGSSDAVTAAIGSTAWTAVARISWVMGMDPTDDTHNRRVVRPAPGSNYRLPEQGLSFTIGDHDETEAGFVTCLEPSDVDPQAITSPSAPAGDEEDAADAGSVLAEILADGPVWVKVAHDAMRDAGFTPKQTRRAKEGLKVRSVHLGKPGDSEQGWKWELPGPPRRPDDSQDAQEAQPSGQGALGMFGPDRASWERLRDQLPPLDLTPDQAKRLEGKLSLSATEGWCRFGPAGTRTPVSDADAADELAARYGSDPDDD